MTIILQVDFPTSGPFKLAMTEAFKALAESINNEKGLLWKIWTENSHTNEAGGIYLFDCHENAENYLTMHKARLEAFGLTNIRSKIFEINTELSLLNHADFLKK